ncbi:hypothetical protein EMCRGX_G009844 [Ephydatia muelleri]
MGHLSSESGVQQGDPLGPLLFALVLHKVISVIDADDECLDLLYQAWYMDVCVLAGNRSAVLRALSLIKELGPSLGLLVNIGKWAPIRDYIYCARFVSTKRSEALKLLSKLEDVANQRPPGCLTAFMHGWQLFQACPFVQIQYGIQAQISLSRGGLGLWSLSKHSCAAFIASFCSSGFVASDNSHLIQAVACFNGLVPPSDATTATSLVDSPPSQRSLSIKLDHFDFQLLFDQSLLADKADCRFTTQCQHFK